MSLAPDALIEFPRWENAKKSCRTLCRVSKSARRARLPSDTLPYQFGTSFQKTSISRRVISPSSLLERPAFVSLRRYYATKAVTVREIQCESASGKCANTPSADHDRTAIAARATRVAHKLPNHFLVDGRIAAMA